jgi:hypothetical protein
MRTPLSTPMRAPADIAAFDQRHAEALRSIWFLGDVHNEFRHIGRALQRCVRANQSKSAQPLPEWLVFLGDQDLELTSFSEAVRLLRQIHPGLNVAFIHGNHDGDSFDKWALLHDNNDAVALHCEVVELSGVRVAGLGGNFQGRVWSPPTDPVFESREALMRARPVRANPPADWVRAHPLTTVHVPLGQPALWPLSPKLLAAIYPQDVTRLSAQRADILVTHEAPSCHRYGWAALDEVARSLRAYRTFHGHTHDDQSDLYALQAENLGFDARAVNFCCIKNGLGELIAGPPEEIKGWS